MGHGHKSRAFLNYVTLRIERMKRKRKREGAAFI